MGSIRERTNERARGRVCMDGDRVLVLALVLLLFFLGRNRRNMTENATHKGKHGELQMEARSGTLVPSNQAGEPRKAVLRYAYRSSPISIWNRGRRTSHTPGRSEDQPGPTSWSWRETWGIPGLRPTLDSFPVRRRGVL